MFSKLVKWVAVGGWLFLIELFLKELSNKFEIHFSFGLKLDHVIRITDQLTENPFFKSSESKQNWYI